MPRPSPSLTALLLLASLATPPLLARQSAAPTVESALDDIRTSLAAIADSMERQEETLRADVLLGRLQIASDDLRSSDAALQNAREQRENIELQLRTMERAMEAERQRRFRESPELDPPEIEDQLREELTRLNLELDRISEQRDLVDARIIELENRVRDRQVERDSLRVRIDRILGLNGG